MERLSKDVFVLKERSCACVRTNWCLNVSSIYHVAIKMTYDDFDRKSMK